MIEDEIEKWVQVSLKLTICDVQSENRVKVGEFTIRPAGLSEGKKVAVLGAYVKSQKNFI